MWNEPSSAELSRLPGLCETDKVPGLDKLIHMHFFLGSCDWYASEYGPRDQLFFGYVILNDDFDCSEWGYFSLPEIREIRVGPGLEVDRDLYWDVRKTRDVERIRQAYEHKGWATS